MVADAIAARHSLDRDVALTRMRGEGIRVVTREMVAFEWLAEAATPTVQGDQQGILQVSDK